MLRKPPLLDLALVAGLLVLGLVSTAAYRSLLEGEDLPSPLTSTTLLLVTVVPLAWRRVHPLSVAVVVGAGFTVLRWLEVPEFDASSLAIFLAVYAAGAYGERRRTVARIVAITPSLAALAWELLTLDGKLIEGSLLWIRMSTIVLNVAFFSAAWILGDQARRRRLVDAELRERTRQLAAERERAAERAVLDERVRIARELHDVVAHHVSVMGLQAGAARRAMDTEPEAVRTALRHVEDSGREAVRELHQMLGLLRQGEGEGDVDPQPGLDRLEQLFAQVRESGLAVNGLVEVRRDEVPDTVGLTAYRIVQEGLTNVVKHAGATAARVVVRRDGSEVVLVVEDDGGEAEGATNGSGLGLIGLQERVALHGGSLTAGPADGRGWRIEARLPVAA